MATATFVNIPVETLVTLLASAGFTEISSSLKGCQERVWARQHGKHKDTQVRVYSSIDQRTGEVRGDSEDRIMVTAFYTGEMKRDKGDDSRTKGKGRFLFGAQGVNRASGEDTEDKRVQGVMDRVLERMRATYGQLNKLQTCPKCGGPVVTRKVRKNTPNKGREYQVCLRCDDFNWTDGKPSATPKADTPKPADTSRRSSKRSSRRGPSKTFQAKFDGDTCPKCGKQTRKGQVVRFNADGQLEHISCPLTAGEREELSTWDAERAARKAAAAESDRLDAERAAAAKAARDERLVVSLTREEAIAIANETAAVNAEYGLCPDGCCGGEDLSPAQVAEHHGKLDAIRARFARKSA